ncbi:MAG: redoxin domain-containing protein [Candidatus Tectomicrobia bacterium]|uniref:Redoxin domain-containing protein n=1 Tax=Tectimicrobiota bacterium TaxID=2528274 RepID=A0A933GN18_UNCTE|nr:redoxin domain-containing protein [Candidatus Tectomicrobia bacterium]
MLDFGRREEIIPGRKDTDYLKHNRKGGKPILKFIFFFRVLIILILAISPSYVSAAESAAAAALGVQPYAGNIVAPDFILKDLNDQKVNLSDYRGSLVIIGFFTTW